MNPSPEHPQPQMPAHQEIKTPRAFPEMPANLDSAYIKAEQLTAENAIKPESFILPDGSNKPIVQNSLDYVAHRKSNFEDVGSPVYKLAKAFEAALFERINKSQWLGKGVTMIMPSEYDDLHNGMDGVLEFQGSQGSKNYLGMGIDVSYSHNPDEKFKIIKEQIDEGRLGMVQYFRNSDNSYNQPLRHLPRGVLVLNAADATRVVRDWDEEVPDTENIIRKVMLRQLEMQLEAYQAYAKKLERADVNRFVIGRFFTAAKESVSALLKEVAKPEEMEEINNHPSLQIIKSQLEQNGFLETLPTQTT